jgi:PAS domain S-box-containing protein
MIQAGADVPVELAREVFLKTTVPSHSAADVPDPPEMGDRVHSMDWSKTALGAAENWPPSLTLIVKIMLASGFPMCVRWGPEFIMIYNDGYRPILRDKHPAAFGLPFHEAWPEVQPQLRPLHEAILNGTSGAFFGEDLLIKVQRHGTSDWEEARFTVSYSPVPDENAPTGVGGVLVTAVETTSRVRTEEALRASEERFARIFEQTGVGIIQCELDGRFLLVNRRFCEIVGRTADELLTLHVPDITHPDDRESDAALRQRLVADGVPFSVEKRYLRPDGSEVWVSVNVSLMRSADGTRQQLIGVAQDITERKVAQEQQSLLVRELNHRIKNLFAITDGMIALSARSATTPVEYANNIRGRLRALAVAHDLILPRFRGEAGTLAEATDLRVLLRTILSPYAELPSDNSDARVILSGSSLPLSARAVTTFALILHELATNAAKYGALSVEEGRLRITWHCADNALIFKWEESGGPALRGPPKSEGFGTVISNHSVVKQFGGTLSHKWDAKGLSVELSVPMDRLSR